MVTRNEQHHTNTIRTCKIQYAVFQKMRKSNCEHLAMLVIYSALYLPLAEIESSDFLSTVRSNPFTSPAKVRR